MLSLQYRIQNRTLNLKIREESVYVPNLVCLITAAQMHVRPGETVYDLGCGSGFISILAAKLGARKVYGIDTSPRALEDARNNAEANGVGKICEFLPGSYIKCLKRVSGKVDVVVSTLPNVRNKNVTRWSGGGSPLLRGSINGGTDGEDSNIQLVRAIRPFMSSKSRLYMSTVDWCSPGRTLKALEEEKFHVLELARAHIPVWGRANNFWAWLVRHPGLHHFNFQFPHRHPRRVYLLQVTLNNRHCLLPQKSFSLEIRS